MTDLLIDYNPEDTGDIPLGIGERTRDLSTHLRRDTTGEATENLGKYLINAPSFEAIPRRTIDLDDTVTYMPATIGMAERVVDETAVHTILDSLAGVRVGLDGELSTPPTTPPPLPKPPRPAVPGRYVGRHRAVREEHPVRGLVWFVLLAIVVTAFGMWQVW